MLRRHQSAQNGRSGLPRCRQCAQKGCSSLLRCCQCAQNGHSGLLWCHQCARKACSSLPQCTECTQRGLFEPAVRDHYSKVLVSVTLCPEPLYSAPLCSMHGHARRCSSLLSEITIRKCGSRLHCALSHCTLLCFATCMDMHGFTLVYIYIYV